MATRSLPLSRRPFQANFRAAAGAPPSLAERTPRHYLALVIPIPLHDDNPRRRFPIVTLALIVVNVVVFFGELGRGLALTTLDYGAIPAFLVERVRDGWVELPDGRVALLHQEVPWPATLLTSMFMHGGWLHLIGNMWFLWLFGDNVEDELGRGRYLIFYLLGGVLAGLSQVAASPDLAAPMVGASGAVATVLGGYLVLHPHARVRCLWILVIFITFVDLPAWLLLGLWFISQFMLPAEAKVAWIAHVGGFVAGLALVKIFAAGRKSLPPPPPPRRLRAVGPLVALVALMGAAGVAHAKRPPPSGDAAKEAIRALLDAQAAAWNRRDLPGYMAGYWKDKGLTFFGGGSVTRGWDETLARYERRYQGPGKEMGALKFDDLEIEPLAADAAYARGRWILTLADGKEQRGLFTLLLKKLPDGWRIVHDHSSM
jgi:membrane associated rhomboid family serine protease/ketosteroid isomerase-like protein